MLKSKQGAENLCTVTAKNIRDDVNAGKLT